jgi:cation:H+ antiporter
LTGLIVGAELLVRGASRLAVAVGISPLVVGMTVVAYGTSAPEVAVTVQAVYATPPQPELALGNVVGSNISNVLLVLGLAALTVPLLVSRSLVRSTVPIMVAVTGLVWWMCLDGQLDRVEGAVLLAGAVLFSVVSIARSRRATVASRAQSTDHESAAARYSKLPNVILNLLFIVVGLVLLVVGAHLLVDGATEVAKLLNVSELIVGLTVVAVGTSLPEIATSLIAGLRGQRDIAVGNVVGSNIFNLLLVLGICAAVAPQPLLVPASALRFDIPIMFAVALACWPIFYTEWVIDRWEGFAFLAFYVAYTAFLYLKSTHHSGLDQYLTVMVWFILPITALVLLVFVVRHWRSGASATDEATDSSEGTLG